MSPEQRRGAERLKYYSSPREGHSKPPRITFNILGSVRGEEDTKLLNAVTGLSLLTPQTRYCPVDYTAAQGSLGCVVFLGLGEFFFP